MSTSIYLIRHGQTEWNKEKIFRGRKDIPLNGRGREEAQALADHLAEFDFAACYASPLGRAFETAEIVARPHRLPVQVDEGIIDINYGVWEGISDDEVQKRFRSLYEKWHSEPHRVRFPGGESLIMVRRRTLSALEGIRSKHPDEHVLVVSHRAVNKVVLCAMLGLGNDAFWRIVQDNCAYNILILSKESSVVALMNDTCHMQMAGLAPYLPDF
jgi:broad specificity phosphatase PhoE